MAPRPITKRTYGQMASCLILMSGASMACGPSVEQMIKKQEAERRQYQGSRLAEEVARHDAEEKKKKDSAKRAQDESDGARKALEEARAASTPAARRDKLEEARRHVQDGLTAAAAYSPIEKKLKEQREEVDRESRAVAALESVGNGGAPADACASAGKGVALARCEREVASAMLQTARNEADGERARQILERASLMVALAGRHSTPRDNYDLKDTLPEQEKVEALLKEINTESARREAAHYVQSPTEIAVVEVTGPTSVARVNLGSSAESVWCAADQVRQSLVSAGVPESRVLVSGVPSKKRDSAQPGAVVINVRPAEREERIIDSAAACRNRTDRGVTAWLNPFILKREHQALLASANALVDEIRTSLERGDLRFAKERIDALAGVSGEVAEVPELRRRFEERCASEAKRAAAGELHGADAGVDRLAACARPLQEVLKMLAEGGQPCSCADEFDARSCAAKRDSAQADLKHAQLVLVDVGTDEIELGTYDFGAKQFPVSIKGKLVEHRFEETCTSKRCDEGAYGWELGVDQNRMRLGGEGAGPLWRDKISVPDVEAARGFKNRADQIKGRLLLVLRAVQVQSRTNPTAAATQKQALAKLAKAKLIPKNAARADEIRAEESCVRGARVAYQEVTASVGTVSVRLLLPSGAPAATLEWPSEK